MSPEKENTFRALKDEELLMTSVWCKLGIHKWTQYREPHRAPGVVYRAFAIPSGYYNVMLQHRTCVNCNRDSHRTFFMFNRDS